MSNLLNKTGQQQQPPTPRKRGFLLKWNMSNEIKISQGITLQYFIPGVFILIAGIITVVQEAYLPGLILIIPGIIITLSVKGVLVDLKNKRIKRYFDFLFFKGGEWMDINGCEKVYLSQTKQSQAFNFLWRTNTIRTKSYDVYIIDKTGNKIEIKEFTVYTEAEIFLQEFSNKTDAKPVNKISEARSKSLARRKPKR